MTSDPNRTIVVLGATGLQGGAVARALLADGWRVRAVSRNPKSKKAQALRAMGADLHQGDMADPASLLPIFQGAYGLFSVQNPVLSGAQGEIAQGKNVADVAAQTAIQHLVYASAGTGDTGAGVPSWETKRVVEAHIKSLDLPATILRPMAFMELMTEKKFFPAVSTWHVMPMLMGGDTSVVWLSVEDLGYIVARVFADPQRFVGQELRLTSDVQSLDQARALYRAILGKNPPRFPMPVLLFQRFGFIGQDLTAMWRWLRTAQLDTDTTPTRAIHPQAHTVESWLTLQKTRQ